MLNKRAAIILGKGAYSLIPSPLNNIAQIKYVNPNMVSEMGIHELILIDCLDSCVIIEWYSFPLSQISRS